MSEVAISVSGVSKTYKLYGSANDRLKEALHPFGKKYHRNFHALKDVNFEVKRGEVVGILGVNGSGKSTLLKLISGVLQPSSGNIHVNGEISALLELGAGFNPEFTGVENVLFYGTVMGLTEEYIRDRLDKIYAFADIGDFIDQPLKTYSSGMKARLGFAVATEIEPEILILDEVLAVGDAAFQRKCYARMQNMLDNGATVLFVSHNRSAVASVCHRAILLDEGHIVSDGDVNEVIKKYELQINKRYTGDIDHAQASSAESDISVKGETLQKSPANYDESLKASPSSVGMANVRLMQVNIVDEDGYSVNVLESGRTYKIIAAFDVGEPLLQIALAIRIKTIQGYVLSWAAHPSKRGEFFSISQPCRHTIELSFVCNFLEGNYALDIGLQSERDGDIEIHCGAHDALLFRVRRTGANTFGHTFVDLKLVDQDMLLDNVLE